ncbi:MAG: GNAT family N-acetyltransferase [Litorimonas sp.]
MATGVAELIEPINSYSSNLMQLPVLTGPLTRLRPLEEDDWVSLYAAASDPQIWGHHFEPDRHKESVFRRFFDNALADGALTIEDRATNSVIGSSRYYDLNGDGSEIKIGYTFLARPYWGGRYNTEIKHLMLEHIFGHVQIVAFDVAQSNHRSALAMRRLGARQRDGEFMKVWNGTTHPYFVFEITYEDYVNSRD